LNARVLFMGGTLLKSETSKENVNHSRVYEVNVNQKYFRPSYFPALNIRMKQFSFFAPYYDKELSDMEIPVKF
jgi:hypothetical protein